MGFRGLILLVGAVALIPTEPIRAQRRLVELPPGVPIRVTARDVVSPPIEGALVGVRSDSVFVVRLADTIGVPLRGVGSVEARIKRTHAKTGARVGLALGMLIGFAVAKSDSSPCARDQFLCGELFAPMLLGAGLGGVAGLVVGSQFGRYEWQQVTIEGLRLSTFPLAPRSVAVGLVFAF
jgi:hypothetical protein